MTRITRKASLTRVLMDVVSDAEDRAAKFRAYVESMKDISDEEWAQLEEDREFALNFVTGLLKEVDDVLHVHSGGSDMMRARRAKTHLLALAAGTVTF